MSDVARWVATELETAPDPAALLELLAAAGDTVATAESLTGGLVTAALTEVPGSSRVVRGGVVAYATDVKAGVLGVDGELLAVGGAVQARVAVELARGARRLLHATWGLGTTGVAGPDVSDGREVGTVYVAVSGPAREEVRRLDLRGLDRSGIRAASVRATLRLLAESRST